MSHLRPGKNLQRSAESSITMKKVISTLVHFEKKLDKLQEDVFNHGQALNDLKTMISNHPAISVARPDGKGGDGKECSVPNRLKPCPSLQYDPASGIEDVMLKSRKKATAPSRLQRKGALKDASENYGIHEGQHILPNKAPSRGKAYMNTKHSKIGAVGKGLTLRSQKPTT